MNTGTISVDRLEGFLRDELGIEGEIPLHSPDLGGAERDYVGDCLEKGWVSTAGELVNRLEEKIAGRFGAGNAVACINGTAALHVALMALGVGPEDAVVCPALTFIATANAVRYCNATPIFADIAPNTLGLDPEKLARFLDGDCEHRANGLFHRQTGCRIRAVVPVHLFGHPADMDALSAVCAAHDLVVIEDAAEAVGSRHRDRWCGTLSHAGVYSFNGNKIVTAGGGGAIVTDDEALAQRMKHLTTTARKPDTRRHDHDAVGFNFRLPSLNAALALAQFERLDDFIARKRRLADAYRDLFGEIAGLRVFREQPWARSNYWLNTLLFDSDDQALEFVHACRERGIMARLPWRPLPETDVYRHAPTAGDLRVTRTLSSRLVNVPSSSWLLSGHRV